MFMCLTSSMSDRKRLYVLPYLAISDSMKKDSWLVIVLLVSAVAGLASFANFSSIIHLLQVVAQRSSVEDQNKALVIAFYNDVYENPNVSTIDKYLADNFSSAVGKGDKQAYENVIDAVHNSFPDLTHSLDHIIAEGDMVVTFNSWNGTFSGGDLFGIPVNGNPFTATTADLFRIYDGQIVQQWVIGDYSNFTQAIPIRLF
jgi:predicted ester cyclase